MHTFLKFQLYALSLQMPTMQWGDASRSYPLLSARASCFTSAPPAAKHIVAHVAFERFHAAQ